jgi:hypothetical protein
MVPQPKASSEPVREPVKSKVCPSSLTIAGAMTYLQQSRSHGKQVRIASLPSGIDLDNVITLRKSGPEMTPPTSSAPTSSYSLRNRGAKQGKLAYDVKYHPMDDLIRPSQAAKRRSAHGEDLTPYDSSSEASTIIDTDANESSNQGSEPEEHTKPTTEGKKRCQTKAQARSVEGTRRSTRKTSEPKISYNTNIHPQDKFLVISSDDDGGETGVSAKKRRKLAHSRRKDDSSSEDEGTEGSKTARQKPAQRTKHLDGIYSNDESAVPSVETGHDKESGK